jgi:predicted CXXCH cytochrome family protein
VRRRRLLLLLLVPALWSGRARAQTGLSTGNSARDCTVCHLNWMEAFRQPGASLLINRPPGSVVSQADTCLGCHDGSVADSRQRVWWEHGHQTGIAPPKGMTVPDILPLEDGKVACRTCHSAHAGAGEPNFAGVFFLRIRNDTSQLCEACHAAFTKGPGLGTHPVGRVLPWPLPEALVAAGAHGGPDDRLVICQTCHTAHGSKQDHLLVMPTDSSQLCLTCHKKLRPLFWLPETIREHPQNPPLNSVAQRQAIKDMGTSVGAGDTLICLSCHKMHHGEAGRYMLADTLQNSHLCLRCHPDRTTIIGTEHDLRVSAPEARNRLGRTAAESGPCGACHSFHQFARRPEPSRIDQLGFCVTCHAKGQCAEKATFRTDDHPIDMPASLSGDVGLPLYEGKGGNAGRQLMCISCHDPHDAAEPKFLRSAPDAVCSHCHDAKVRSLASVHDFSAHPELKNAQGRDASQTGKCGFCHFVHDARGPALWGATQVTPEHANDFCLECHQSSGMAASWPIPDLRHPSGPSTAGSRELAGAKLPLFSAQCQRATNGMVACSTCHDLHGVESGGSTPLLRRAGAASPEFMCLDCHTSRWPIIESRHSPQDLQEYGKTAQACGPCHSAHARAGMAASGMWAAPPGPASVSLVARRCLGCHSNQGGAPPVTPAVHPAVALRNVNPPNSPGFLPLVDPDGKPDPLAGQILCETCHLPHGRETRQFVPAIEPTTRPGPGGHELNSIVRPYITPNLCGTCHGVDGLRRFLYFHHPFKRANEQWGPVTLPPGFGGPVSSTQRSP